MKYWVLGRHPWNKQIFDDVICKYPGEWHYIGFKEELTVEAVEKEKPDILFFMHWSWKVPVEITDNYVCIAFHPSDLPDYRGGSPIQHQILDGRQLTKVTAFRMTQEMDAGPIYFSDWLDLYGTAEEIYVRMSYMVAEMIEELINGEITPKPQTKGNWRVYSRRTPPMSRVPVMGTLGDMHDFIRMLDASGYPKAYLVIGNYRYEFHGASLYHDRIEANVVITKVKQDE